MKLPTAEESELEKVATQISTMDSFQRNYSQWISRTGNIERISLATIITINNHGTPN
jgi:hypothetical protein